ncbi:MAG: SDR family oxidoreductase [Anaerolineaceae bacterium]|nr:SDR family oxidoreductase [Anaerolineaceae bacterium]
MDPKNKTALVTGGAVRVGKAITLGLARAGVNVAINYHSSIDEAQATSNEALAIGVKAFPVQADVSDPEQVMKMVAEAQNQLGTIDILINSASFFKVTPLPTANLELWQRVTRVMIDGAFYCSNEVAPQMIAEGQGVIINILDLSPWQPAVRFAAHNVGKAALLALTRQLAVDLSPQIRVNAIAPGAVLPPVHYDAAKIQQVAQRNLLKRWGTPEDVIQTTLFLIRSDFITGEVIVVDGGERYGRSKNG